MQLLIILEDFILSLHWESQISTGSASLCYLLDRVNCHAYHLAVPCISSVPRVCTLVLFIISLEGGRAECPWWHVVLPSQEGGHCECLPRCHGDPVSMVTVGVFGHRLQCGRRYSWQLLENSSYTTWTQVLGNALASTNSHFSDAQKPDNCRGIMSN